MVRVTALHVDGRVRHMNGGGCSGFVNNRASSWRVQHEEPPTRALGVADGLLMDKSRSAYQLRTTNN